MGKEDESAYWEGYEFLDEELDFYRGLDEPKYRRRRAGTAGGGGVIVITPSTLTANDGMAVGTVIGTVAVSGGSGTYTFSLVDPSGRFTIVGNQIQVASPLTPGFYNVTINASNGLGDSPTLPAVIFVSHFSVTYVPTYYLYGF